MHQVHSQWRLLLDLFDRLLVNWEAFRAIACTRVEAIAIRLEAIVVFMDPTPLPGSDRLAARKRRSKRKHLETR